MVKFENPLGTIEINEEYFSELLGSIVPTCFGVVGMANSNAFQGVRSFFDRKTRYLEKVGSHTWEIDIFEGDNAGLAVAEIELANADEEFEMPDWVLQEVSDDKRYRNAYLVENPWNTWQGK